MSHAARRDFDAAEAACRTALRLQPGCFEAACCLALIQLVHGRFDRGFLEFEARLKLAGAARPPARGQAWTNQPVEGQRVLVYAEDGQGDTIQFSRYVPLLAARADVSFQVPAALLRLMSGLPGVSRIVDRVPADLAFDLHCPLMSLPQRMGPIEPIPCAVPYLTASPMEIESWRTRLAALPGLKVGLAWAGNPRYLYDLPRSIAPATLLPLTGIEGVTLVSLQKGESRHKTPEPWPLLDWTGELNDFASTAALIEALDLVISVDTAVAHLAGALGKPVWLLNRYDTDWRWLLDGPDSPWYPTMRVFRQPRLGDWAFVVEEVRTCLARRAAEQGEGPGGPAPA